MRFPEASEWFRRVPRASRIVHRQLDQTARGDDPCAGHSIHGLLCQSCGLVALAARSFDFATMRADNRAERSREGQHRFAVGQCRSERGFVGIRLRCIHMSGERLQPGQPAHEEREVTFIASIDRTLADCPQLLTRLNQPTRVQKKETRDTRRRALEWR